MSSLNMFNIKFLLKSSFHPLTPIFVGSWRGQYATKWRGVSAELSYNTYLRNGWVSIDTGVKSETGMPIVEFSAWEPYVSRTNVLLPNVLSYKFFFKKAFWRVGFLTRTSFLAKDRWSNKLPSHLSVFNNTKRDGFLKVGNTGLDLRIKSIQFLFIRFAFCLARQNFEFISVSTRFLTKSLASFRLFDTCRTQVTGLVLRPIGLFFNMFLLRKINTKLYSLSNLNVINEKKLLICKKHFFSLFDLYFKFTFLFLLRTYKNMSGALVVFFNLTLTTLLQNLVSLVVTETHLIKKIMNFLYKKFIIFLIKPRLNFVAFSRVFSQVFLSILSFLKQYAKTLAELPLSRTGGFSLKPIVSYKLDAVWRAAFTINQPIGTFTSETELKLKDFLGRFIPRVFEKLNRRKKKQFYLKKAQNYKKTQHTVLGHPKAVKQQIRKDSGLNTLFANRQKHKFWDNRWQKRFVAGLLYPRVRKRKPKLATQFKFPFFKKQFSFLYFWSLNFFSFFIVKANTKKLAWVRLRLKFFFRLFFKFLKFYAFTVEYFKIAIVNAQKYHDRFLLKFNSLKSYFWLLLKYIRLLMSAFFAFSEKLSYHFFSLHRAKISKSNLGLKLALVKWLGSSVLLTTKVRRSSSLQLCSDVAEISGGRKVVLLRAVMLRSYLQLNSLINFNLRPFSAKLRNYLKFTLAIRRAAYYVFQHQFCKNFVNVRSRIYEISRANLVVKKKSRRLSYAQIIRTRLFQLLRLSERFNAKYPRFYKSRLLSSKSSGKNYRTSAILRLITRELINYVPFSNHMIYSNTISRREGWLGKDLSPLAQNFYYKPNYLKSSSLAKFLRIKQNLRAPFSPAVFRSKKNKRLLLEFLKHVFGHSELFARYRGRVSTRCLDKRVFLNFAQLIRNHRIAGQAFSDSKTSNAILTYLARRFLQKFKFLNRKKHIAARLQFTSLRLNTYSKPIATGYLNSNVERLSWARNLNASRVAKNLQKNNWASSLFQSDQAVSKVRTFLGIYLFLIRRGHSEMTFCNYYFRSRRDLLYIIFSKARATRRSLVAWCNVASTAVSAAATYAFAALFLTIKSNNALTRRLFVRTWYYRRYIDPLVLDAEQIITAWTSKRVLFVYQTDDHRWFKQNWAVFSYFFTPIALTISWLSVTGRIRLQSAITRNLLNSLRVTAKAIAYRVEKLSRSYEYAQNANQFFKVLFARATFLSARDSFRKTFLFNRVLAYKTFFIPLRATLNNMIDAQRELPLFSRSTKDFYWRNFAISRVRMIAQNVEFNNFKPRVVKQFFPKKRRIPGFQPNIRFLKKKAIGAGRFTSCAASVQKTLLRPRWNFLSLNFKLRAQRKVLHVIFFKKFKELLKLRVIDPFVIFKSSRKAVITLFTRALLLNASRVRFFVNAESNSSETHFTQMQESAFRRVRSVRKLLLRSNARRLGLFPKRNKHPKKTYWKLVKSGRIKPLVQDQSSSKLSFFDRRNPRSMALKTQSRKRQFKFTVIRNQFSAKKRLWSYLVLMLEKLKRVLRCFRSKNRHRKLHKFIRRLKKKKWVVRRRRRRKLAYAALKGVFFLQKLHRLALPYRFLRIISLIKSKKSVRINHSSRGLLRSFLLRTVYKFSQISNRLWNLAKKNFFYESKLIFVYKFIFFFFKKINFFFVRLRACFFDSLSVDTLLVRLISAGYTSVGAWTLNRASIKDEFGINYCFINPGLFHYSVSGNTYCGPRTGALIVADAFYLFSSKVSFLDYNNFEVQSFVKIFSTSFAFSTWKRAVYDSKFSKWNWTFIAARFHVRLRAAASPISFKLLREFQRRSSNKKLLLARLRRVGLSKKFGVRLSYRILQRCKRYLFFKPRKRSKFGYSRIKSWRKRKLVRTLNRALGLKKKFSEKAYWKLPKPKKHISKVKFGFSKRIVK